MVCLPDQLPLLTFGDREAVTYESDWLVDEITRAAAKAGHDDWFFADDLTRAVTKYLRHRHPCNTISIEELNERVELALEHMGCGDIAASLEIGPPAASISLKQLAGDFGVDDSEQFFEILRERITAVEASGVSKVICVGLRKCCKGLCGVTRWTPESDELSHSIRSFVVAEFTRLRPSGNVDLVIR